MTDFETLRLETDARGIATLSLDRPDKHNALNAVMMAELRRAAEELAGDASVRAVVLRADGKSFCAGADLDWMRSQAEQDRAGKMAQSITIAHMLRALDQLPQPLIGRVQGAAYGGGIGIMAVCDVVIANEAAKFCLTETRLGLVPANIGPYVIRRLGEGRARRVFFTGRVFDGREAQELGLVSVAVAEADLDARIEEELAWILQCAPGAMRDAKRLCLDLAREPRVDQDEWTAARLADRWETEEAQEGIRAFFAREKPAWTR